MRRARVNIANCNVLIFNDALLQLRGKNTEKIGADTGSNVCLKMNVKNGGVNHVVADE